MVDRVKAMPDDGQPEHPREDFTPPLDAEGRVRLFVHLYDHPNVAGEIVSDDRFRSDEWPRRMYALSRTDLVEVLKDLDIYEDELSKANARAVRDAKRIAEEQKKLKAARDMIESLQINGARHWFKYGYQKCTNTMLSHWTSFCSTCDKERDHPTHFAADAEYLDSRMVEKAAQKALERVQGFLDGGLKMPEERARRVALELLQDLPGIEPEEPVAGT